MNVTLIYVSNTKVDFEHLGIALIASYLRYHQINVKMHGINIYTNIETVIQYIFGRRLLWVSYV